MRNTNIFSCYLQYNCFKKLVFLKITLTSILQLKMFKFSNANFCAKQLCLLAKVCAIMIFMLKD